MAQSESDGRPSGTTPEDRAAAQDMSEQEGTIQSMGPQAEMLDRLLDRTELELGAAQSRRGWSLFSVLRAAYRTLASDSNK